jgi:hypothetical protein
MLQFEGSSVAKHFSWKFKWERDGSS